MDIMATGTDIAKIGAGITVLAFWAVTAIGIPVAVVCVAIHFIRRFW